MSPEFFDPKILGHCQTKHSDCYALGMVIYEVLSGRVPFHQYAELVIPGKVFGGDRPEKPQGAEGAYFTSDVWEVAGHCWTPQPANRPNVEDVLLCLEKVSGSWMPLSPQPDGLVAHTGSPLPNTITRPRDMDVAASVVKIAVKLAENICGVPGLPILADSIVALIEICESIPKQRQVH